MNLRKNNFDIFLKKIKKYYWDFWIIPTFDTMVEITWNSSKTTITKFFNELVEKWYLKKENKKYIPMGKLSSIPLFSKISCWNSDEINIETENYIDLNKYVIWWNPSWIILLETKWDSMGDLWIFEWDIVSVDLNNKYPRNWDLVIVTINWENEFTLKEFWKSKDWKSYLFYRNYTVYKEKTIAANEINIVWVVKWLVRKF